MNLLSNVSTAISSIGEVSRSFNAVCSSVSAVGKAVAEFAHDIKPVLGPLLTSLANVVPHPAVKAVLTFANALIHVLAIFHPEETVQDMGERALQAADNGITLDKFENFEEYMSELRAFPIDPEVAKTHSPVEQIVAGLGIATAGIEDKFNIENGSLNDVWLLPLTNSEYFTPERVEGLLENGKIIGDVSAYLEKSMSGEDASDFRKNLEITPEGKPMNDTELGKLYDALDSARTEWTTLEQKLKTDE